MRKKTILCITNAIETQSDIDELRVRTQEFDTIYLLQILPGIPVHYYRLPSFRSLETKWHQQAEQSLATLGKAIDVPCSQQFLERGRAHHIVRTFTNTIPTDSIYTAQGCYEIAMYLSTVKRLHVYLYTSWSNGKERCAKQTRVVLRILSKGLKKLSSLVTEPQHSTTTNPFYTLYRTRGQ